MLGTDYDNLQSALDVARARLESDLSATSTVSGNAVLFLRNVVPYEQERRNTISPSGNVVGALVNGCVVEPTWKEKGERKERERREKGERERREKGESEESVCSTHNTPSLSLSLMLAAHFPRFPLAVSRLRSPHAPWLQQQQTTTNNNKQQQQQHSTTTVVLGSYAAAAEISCADFEQSSASLFQNQGFATDVSECNVNNIVLNITMYVRSTTSFETEESVYVCE